MARHEVVIHQNTGATSESAPYTGNYISKETVAESAFAEAVASKCGLPAIQVATIIDGAFEAFEELESAGLVRVHTDLGVVCGVISGSFPTSDAAFDPERNSLELALRLDDSIRLDLADATAAIVTDADLTRVRVDNVMDVEEQKPMNLIHGRHVFRVAGYNMVLSDEGAAACLQNQLGTTFPLVVDEVVSKQLFRAHTAELLDGGDYKLVVKSRGGDAEGPLQTSFRRVKYLHVVDPAPTPAWTTGDGQVKVFSASDDETGETFTFGDLWKVLGEGFRNSEAGWFPETALIQPTPESEGAALEIGTSDDGELQLRPEDVTALAPGDYPNAVLSVGFAHNSEEGLVTEGMSLPVHLVVAG